jgi:hypothetical protein
MPDSTMENQYRNLIQKAYDSFNARDIDAVFATMDPDVEWPNGQESGYLIGFDDIRDYWTRQWKEIDPMVKPIGYRSIGDGRIEVEVHQVAKDLIGNILFEGKAKHVYSFKNGLIKVMEIENEH